MITSARIVMPGQAMATIPMMRASTPIRIKEVDVDLNAVGIALASIVFSFQHGVSGRGTAAVRPGRGRPRPQGAARSVGMTMSRFWILPVGPLGSASTNHTWRGYLY